MTEVRPDLCLSRAANLNQPWTAAPTADRGDEWASTGFGSHLVRISHPLAAIYTLIHPNRSQHSQPRFWRRAADLLYLHAEWTRRPSN